MEISSISLTNWRNFSQKKIAFNSKLTAIVGKNGSGKSNILEAVAMLAGIRPTRVDTELDLIKIGESEAKVEGEVESGGEKYNLVINFQLTDAHRVAKSFFVGVIRKRLVDFVDIFSVVIFEPADLDLVSGSPSLRRHHMDRFLSSVDTKYWRAVSAYGKIIVRRNKVLLRIQEGRSKPLELGFWDARLVEHGKYISKTREEFFEFLNFVNVAAENLLGHSFGRDGRSVGNLHKDKVAQNSKITSSRAPSLNSYFWEFKQSVVSEEKLLKNRERDVAAGVTLSGPHRDDFRFKCDRDLEFFGSRGEQRMAVLALKLAELEYFRVKRGVRPLLALDDIFSELDWEHRETVLSVVGNQQTIITAAEKESIPKEIFKKAKIVEL